MKLEGPQGAIFLELVHRCATGSFTITEFEELVRGPVRSLLPHRGLISLLGRLSFDQLVIERLVGVDFPQAMIDTLDQHFNIRERPVIARWFAERAPIVVDAERDAAQLSDLERHEFRTYQLGRMALHGQLDLSSHTGSYFSFAGVTPDFDEARISFLLQIITPPLHAALLSVFKAAPAPDSAPGLSNVEKELLTWLAAGRSNAEIALLRGRSEATVRNQLHKLYRKIGAGSRAEAVAISHRLYGPHL